MNALFQPKLIVTLSFICLILSFVGCSPERDSQAATDKTTFLYYTLRDEQSDTTIDYRSSNAKETEEAMALYHMLLDFTKDTDALISSEAFANKDLYHTYQLTAYDQEAQTYSYQLSFDHNEEVYLTHHNETKHYPSTTLTTLFDSGVFNRLEVIDKTPVVELHYNDLAVDSLTSTLLSHTYFDLYTQEESGGIIPDTAAINDLFPIDINADVPRFVLYNPQDNTPFEGQYNQWTIDSVSMDYTDSSGQLVAHSNDVELPDLSYGTYIVTCTLSFTHQLFDAQYKQTLYFPVHYDSTESFAFAKTSYEPGDLAVLIGSHLSEDLTYSVDTSIYNQGLSFIHEEDNSYLILPLMSRTTPDSYDFTVTVSDDGTPIKTYDFVIDVTDKAFEIQHLTTSSSVASVRNNDNYAIMNADFSRGRSESYPTKLWDGPFVQPVGGRISTEYGVIRYTNGSTESSRHSGIDFANPEGTPVVATQNGYIRLAKENPVTGMTIFIDHGAGIYSQYYHLSSMSVAEGDYIEKGSVIGAIGTTGFSTGPHLHFCIYNNGIYLNPWKFFEKAPY